MVTAPRPSNTPSIFQLLLGIAGFCMSIFISAGMFIVLNFGPALDEPTKKMFSYIAWVFLALAIPSIISVILSIRRFLHKPEKAANRVPSWLPFSLAALVLLPLGVLAVSQILGPSRAWMMAVGNIILVVIPAWGFVELGRLRLPKLSRQKQWGLVNFASFVTMPVILLIETALLIAGAAFLFNWLIQKPEYASLADMFNNLMYVNPSSLPLILDQLQQVMQNPGVIAAVITGIALVVPMIEELLKPMALWFFIKSHWSPADGFVAGMISGAAFAAIETLTAVASADPGSLLVLVAARTGTSLLHVTTAGLTGWALTSTWLDGKYLRAALAYLLAVFLHGAWNFMAVAVGIGNFTQSVPLPSFEILTSAAPYLMAVLAAGFIALLVTINRHLRKQRVHLPLPPQLPPPLPGEIGVK